MSITPVNTSPLLPSLGAPRTDASRAQNAGQPGVDRAALAAQQARANQAAALKPQAPIAGQNTAQGAVPAEAPPGTDPTLWSVLTSEERNFFAKTAALGPLTYSRLKDFGSPTPPVARGVRLDVRA